MRTLSMLLISILMAGAIACTKGGKLSGVNGAVYTITATASARQLVPSIDTTSTGSIKGIYDEELNTLTFTLAWDDLWRDTKKDTITSVSFYGPATAAANGDLVRTLPLVNVNKAGSINLGLAGGTGFSAAEEAAFLSGAYYFTVNTKRYPSGIIRGQLTVSQ